MAEPAVHSQGPGVEVWFPVRQEQQATGRQGNSLSPPGLKTLPSPTARGDSSPCIQGLLSLGTFR